MQLRYVYRTFPSVLHKIKRMTDEEVAKGSSKNFNKISYISKEKLIYEIKE